MGLSQFIVGISMITLCNNKPTYTSDINRWRPRQNGPDDIFTCNSLKENIRYSLKFDPKVPIDNIPALIQIMTSHQAIIGTNGAKFSDACMRHSVSTSWSNIARSKTQLTYETKILFGTPS